MTSTPRARRPRKARASAELVQGLGAITEVSIADYAQKMMSLYAEEVNLDRSVPDLFDGLKTVQRRILWEAHLQGQGFKKTARIVGGVIGRWHPHGDGSVSGAITTLVQQQTPPMLGSGNWGGLLDPAAAMRYTNCKLSKYGESFFQPEYISKEVSSFVPNYDDLEYEPVRLPAMLPNVLLNGAEGIGVGVTTSIPTFHAESVVKVLKRILAGEKLTAVDYAKTLKFATRWGGHLVNDKKNRDAYLNLFSNGTASLQFEADYTVDRDNKLIDITGWPPGLNVASFVTKARAIEGVSDVFNHEGDTGYRVEVRKDYNYTQFDKIVERVKKLAISRRGYRINVTHRKASVVDGKVSFETSFLSVSIPSLLKLWLRERLLLEKASLEFRIRNQERDIAYSELLIHAADNLDIIFKALRSDNPQQLIAKGLKITPEQAAQILDLRVRQLSKLDKAQIQDKLKAQRAMLKTLHGYYKAPKAKIAADMDAALLVILADRKYEGSKSDELTVSE